MTLRPLPYVEQLESRCTDCINMVVIHCTELPDLSAAREWGEKVIYPTSGTGNSGHYYIDRDGATQEWVPVNRVAHHVKGYNPKSIGVELVNRGRYPDWFDSNNQDMSEPYPAAQINALIELLNKLVARLPDLALVAGHEDLDTGLQPSADDPEISIKRKLDPGPLFPWDQLLAGVLLARNKGNPSP